MQLQFSLNHVLDMIILNRFDGCLNHINIGPFVSKLKSPRIDLFLNSDSFLIAYHISLVKVQINCCNNNPLTLDVKQLNKIIKLYYFYILKAVWDGKGKIKIYYGMSRVKK